MWTPMSPRTPFDPCFLLSRQSHWLSVRQSPQALLTSQDCK